MSLLQKIRQRKRQPAEAPAPATEDVAKLVAAKTGKASTGPAAPISTQAPRAATQAAEAQVDELQRQQVVQAAEATGKEEAIKQQQRMQEAEIELGEEKLASKKRQAMADIQQNLNQSFEKLGLSKEQAAMESRLFERRMQDQKYLDQLKKDSTLERAFKTKNRREALLQAQLGDEMYSLMQKLANKKELSKLQSEYTEILSSINAESVLDAADIAAKGEQKRAILTGIATIASGAAT